MGLKTNLRRGLIPKKKDASASLLPDGSHRMGEALKHGPSLPPEHTTGLTEEEQALLWMPRPPKPSGS